MADQWLEGPVTSSAFGWRLERSDGVTIGFTSHDQDVMLDGLRYRASPGLVPTSITERSGLEDGGLDLKGALSSDAIRADDLRAGKWHGAMLEIFLFDWAHVNAGRRPLATGWLGSVEFDASGFSVEVDGPASRLLTPFAPFTSPTCRAHFCDAKCSLNGQRFRHRALLSAIEDVEIVINGLASADLAKFDQGEMRWQSGANCGFRHSILGTTATALILDRPPPEIAEPGAVIELYEGCDKRFSTCAERFGNAVNFRGEPYLPGNDLLTRFPGV